MYQTWNGITWICPCSSNWFMWLPNVIYHSYGSLCAEKFRPWLGIDYANSWCMCCSKDMWDCPAPVAAAILNSFKYSVCLAGLHPSFSMTHTTQFPEPIVCPWSFVHLCVSWQAKGQGFVSMKCVRITGSLISPDNKTQLWWYLSYSFKSVVQLEAWLKYFRS